MRKEYVGAVPQRAGGLVFLIILLMLLCFGLLYGRQEAFDQMALVVGGGAAALILLHYMIMTLCFPECDRQLLALTYLFAAIGLVMQYRLDASVALKQLVWLGVSSAAMLVALICVVFFDRWERFRYPFMVLTLCLLPLGLLFGRETGGAYNWLQFSGFSFQPSEVSKVLLVFILAAFLREKRSIIKLAPVAVFTALCVGLLVIQKDLGAALLYFITFVALIYISTSSVMLSALSLGAGACGAVASYFLFDHIRVRIAIWQNPWIDVQGSGYQIVQALMAIASGGTFGLGLGQGLPRLIPAYHTDFIFAAICEEMGILVGLLLIVCYILFIIRGARIAMRAGDAFRMLLAMGCTVMIGAQTFLILGGVIKMIPLTGVTLPFISYGGSSLFTNMCLLGVLEAVAVRTGREQAAAEVEE